MMNVSNAFLLDTNVLVYPHDPRDRDKQQRGLFVLNRLIADRKAVLSVQCLSEFFRVSTRRLPEPLSTADALAQVVRLASACHVLSITQPVVLEGCQGAVRHQLSVCDALIWAVAKLNQVPCVLTEDAEHGRFLEGVLFLNPFTPAFDLDLLGR